MEKGGEGKKNRELILIMSKNGMGVSEISHRLKISRSYVYRIIKKSLVGSQMVHRGGVSTGGRKPSFPMEKPERMDKYRWRGHNFHFDVRIIWASDSYAGFKKSGTVRKLEGWTLVLFKQKIEAYSTVDFRGDSPSEALECGLASFLAILGKFEAIGGVVVLKARSDNVVLVRSHFAEVGNEIAKDYDARGLRLAVYAEDGKLAFLYDRSVSPFVELEAVHPDTAKGDADKVEYFLKDLRRAELTNFSEIKALFIEMAKLQRDGFLEIKEVLVDLALAQKVSVETIQAISLLLKILISPDKSGESDLKEGDKKDVRRDYIG